MPNRLQTVPPHRSLRLPLLAVLLALGLATPRAEAAEAPVLLRLDHLALQQIAARGFALTAEQTLEISGVAFQKSEIYGEITRAWILDKRSRRVVWDLGDARLVGRGRETRRFASEVKLPAGDYELYYSTFPASAWKLDGDLDWFDMMGVRGPDIEDYREVVGELELVLRGRGELREPPRAGGVADPRTVLTLEAVASSKRARGFALLRPTRLEIYAVGELAEDGRFDYGWISDLGTGRKVWVMSWEGSEAAGGARKNRRARATLELPPGRYAAHWVADDSHGPGAWNAPPPYDPFSWGLTVRLQDVASRTAVSTFEVQEPKEGEVVAAITKVGNGECRSLGFTLKRPLQARIYALGEGSEGELYDYAWLVDAKTRRKVWAMSYPQTEPAGGARKNRMAEEVLELPAGSYLLHYVSDGSHSYVDWNAAAPADREHWGVTVYALSAGFDHKSWVAPYAEDETAGTLLVDLTRVGSDQQREQKFRLARQQQVRLEVVGEGGRGRMVDYGWLEDGQGRRVWELTLRMTDAAGGAAKNRRYDGVIELPAGDYVAHFVTDDSHAFGDFNDDPPREPAAWGLRVYAVTP